MLMKSIPVAAALSLACLLVADLVATSTGPSHAMYSTELVDNLGKLPSSIKKLRQNTGTTEQPPLNPSRRPLPATPNQSPQHNVKNMPSNSPDGKETSKGYVSTESGIKPSEVKEYQKQSDRTSSSNTLKNRLPLEASNGPGTSSTSRRLVKPIQTHKLHSDPQDMTLTTTDSLNDDKTSKALTSTGNGRSSDIIRFMNPQDTCSPSSKKVDITLGTIAHTLWRGRKFDEHTLLGSIPRSLGVWTAAGGAITVSIAGISDKIAPICSIATAQLVDRLLPKPPPQPQAKPTWKGVAVDTIRLGTHLTELYYTLPVLYATIPALMLFFLFALVGFAADAWLTESTESMRQFLYVIAVGLNALFTFGKSELTNVASTLRDLGAGLIYLLPLVILAAKSAQKTAIKHGEDTSMYRKVAQGAENPGTKDAFEKALKLAKENEDKVLNAFNKL